MYRKKGIDHPKKKKSVLLLILCTFFILFIPLHFCHSFGKNKKIGLGIGKLMAAVVHEVQRVTMHKKMVDSLVDRYG